MFGFLKRSKNASGEHNFIRTGGGAGAAVAQKVDVSGFNKAINFCLLALTFLMPIAFLAWTSSPLEFTKQAIVFFATAIMLGVWVIKILTTRSVSWVKTSLDYILLAYLVIYFLTSIVSIDRVSSFLGYYGRFTGSFISVLALVVMYFLLVNNVKTERMIGRIVNYFTAGAGVALVFGLFQLLGWHILPSAADRGFNTIGSLVSLALFAVFSLLFFQWASLHTETSKRKKWVLGVLSVIALVIIFLINAFTAWLILALSMIAFIALSMASAKSSSATWFWKPMLVLVVSVLFVAFQFLPAVLNPRNVISVDLPVEIQLSNSTTWSLVGNTYQSGIKNAILGSGPGTTGIAFGDIKPEDLNKTIVWSLNFDRASTEVSNIAIESGILGLLAFELTAILFLFYGLFFLMRRTDHPGWKYAFGFFMLWLALYLTHFFYFFNTTFYFMYWFSIGMFMAAAHLSAMEQEERSLSFASSPRSALSWMFVSLLLLAALLVGTFFQAAVYGAEVSYAKGVRELNKAEPDFGKASDSFARAVTMNPYRDVYYLAYGQNLIFRASEEAAKEEPDVALVQAWMGDLVAAGLRATEISPNKASNWSALAQFYTGIRPLVSGTDERIIASWQKAIEKDPKNPALYVQLAQAYATASQTLDPSIAGSGADTDQDGLADSKEQELGSAPDNSDTNGNGVSDGDEVKAGFNPSGTGRLDNAQLASFTKVDQAKLAQAQEALNRAIELKPDLPDSYIALSRVLQQSNKLDEAKQKLTEAVEQFPGNPDIRFELGVINFNQRNFTEAEKIFQNVIALEPNYANAHYSLGLIFEQRGDRAKALTSYEKAREISGPNVDLEKRINDLKAAIAPAGQ